MVTQTQVVEQILAALGTGKMTVDEAVAKAEATKPLKNKNKLRNWANHFKTQGVVTEENGVKYVTAKPVAQVTPVVAPVVEAPKA